MHWFNGKKNHNIYSADNEFIKLLEIIVRLVKLIETSVKCMFRNNENI